MIHGGETDKDRVNYDDNDDDDDNKDNEETDDEGDAVGPRVSEEGVPLRATLAVGRVIDKRSGRKTMAQI